MNTPKERPILFSGDMVRAILDSRKTQTRRLIKPQPDIHHRRHRWGYVIEEGILKYGRAPWRKTDPYNFIVEKEIRCPFGKVGDRLWVRETFCIVKGNGIQYRYRADGPPMQTFYPNEEIPNIKWTPSIHMPRKACRLILEITDVRVERLQDISAGDVLAEGTPKDHADFELGGEELHSHHVFRKFWDSINGNTLAAWAQNPWVWGIEFKRVEC